MRRQRWPGKQKGDRRRFVSLVVALGLVVFATGATIEHFVDPRDPLGESERARREIRLYADHVKARRDAMVTLLRDTRASIELLRELSGQEGPVADQARAALQILGDDLK